MSEQHIRVYSIRERTIEPRLIAIFRRMFPEADEVRLSYAGTYIFLLLGFRRSTRDDPGKWVDQDGRERHWEYLREDTVAYGHTSQELIDSAKNYKRLKETGRQYVKRP